ncbi:MAG: hypothetical protein WCO84_01265 [bacterium]
MFTKLFTKNLTKIPLMYVFFNKKLYDEQGKQNSCLLNLHPTLKDDKFIISEMNLIVDYIRDNYDMDKLI